MNNLYRLFGGVLMGVMILFLAGCGDHDDDPETKKEVKETALKFEARSFNESGESKSSANSTAGNVTLNWTMNITINGQLITSSGTRKGNELPVVPGEEIEIVFEPTCPEETDAIFILPDGTTREVSSNEPSFRWIVPEKFKTGDKIIGESQYETENYIFNAIGEISLISVVDNK